MPKVLVSDKLSETAVQIFRDRGVEVDYLPDLGKDKEKLAEVIGQYDGLAIRSATKVTAKLLEAATNLKVIGRAGIGVDNVDIPAASKKGVIVMNTPFGNSVTTAEHAIALMFAVARQLPEASVSTHEGKWEKNRFMGVEVFNKTLGIIGAGNIGSIVIDRALGLKMKVLAYDPFLSEERAKELGVKKVELDELLAKADFITLHVPLTEKTRNILSRESLAKTKKGVRIVNAARGGLIDEEALYTALTTGQIAAAGVMVLLGVQLAFLFLPFADIGTLVLDPLQAGLLTVAITVAPRWRASCTATEPPWISTRWPGCAGQAAASITASAPS